MFNSMRLQFPHLKWEQKLYITHKDVERIIRRVYSTELAHGQITTSAPNIYICKLFIGIRWVTKGPAVCQALCRALTWMTESCWVLQLQVLPSFPSTTGCHPLCDLFLLLEHAKFLHWLLSLPASLFPYSFLAPLIVAASSSSLRSQFRRHLLSGASMTT